MTPKTKYLAIMLVAALLLVGCSEQIGDYISASSISKDGFARDAEALRKMDGQEIKIWGFVDHSNMYGDEDVKTILEDSWSGDGPNADTWRFNLKARADDEAGHSFSVQVPNDEGRDDLLRVFLADARAQRPTKVFLTGKIFTFEAPTNAAPLTGLYMEAQSSRDVVVALPDDKR